jgi:hypothetical protein
MNDLCFLVFAGCVGGLLKREVDLLKADKVESSRGISANLNPG